MLLLLLPAPVLWRQWLALPLFYCHVLLLLLVLSTELWGIWVTVSQRPLPLAALTRSAIFKDPFGNF
jgi:hypothetical protein